MYSFWWVYSNIRSKCAFQWDWPFGYLLLQSSLFISFAHFSIVFFSYHFHIESSSYIVQYMCCQYILFRSFSIHVFSDIPCKKLALFIVFCTRIFYSLLAMLKLGLSSVLQSLSSFLQRNSWDIGYEECGRVSWSSWHIKMLAPVASHQNKNVNVLLFTMCHIVF